MEELIDLTYSYHVGMSVPPGVPPPHFRPVKRLGVDRANVTDIIIRSHQGTHIDAPAHYIGEGAYLEELPIDRFYGNGVVIGLRKNRLEPVNEDDLKKYESVINGTKFCFISFGWGELFGTEEYLFHPYLDEDAANKLVGLGISFLGVDTFSPEMPAPIRPPKDHGPVHHILLDNDVLIIENVANLRPLEGYMIEVFAFPMKYEQSDGAPVRLVCRRKEMF